LNITCGPRSEQTFLPFYSIVHHAFQTYGSALILFSVVRGSSCYCSKILLYAETNNFASHLLSLADTTYTVSLKGVKSGDLYHNNITSLTNVVQILGFNFSALEPRDAASGLPTGKPQFSPVTLYKEMDVSSPLLLQVLTNNEIFQATITAVEPATSQYFRIISCLEERDWPKA
jgi:hypothetical protein